MNKTYLEQIFSVERMGKYFAAYPDNEARCIALYQCNILISEAFYSSISMLEVALRNKINKELIRTFGCADWYNHFSNTPGLNNLVKEISAAQYYITKRREIVTPSKVVAELTLGFWVRLFNAEYERILWKDLRFVFSNLPKSQRKRNTVSAPLNKFRELRNRIFHNEPICWNFNRLESRHRDIVMLLGWLNQDLPDWLQTLDKFDDVLNDVRISLFSEQHLQSNPNKKSDR